MFSLQLVQATLDKYGLHLDAKQVLRKIGGRRPGKRCKNGWIAADKQCSDHKTADGKLTAAGRASARELAGKVRDRKGMPDKREVTIARTPLKEFIGETANAPTASYFVPKMTKIHKEARSELNKRRINGGRGAIVDKKKSKPTPKKVEGQEVGPSNIEKKIAWESKDANLYVFEVSKNKAEIRLNRGSHSIVVGSGTLEKAIRTAKKMEKYPSSYARTDADDLQLEFSQRSDSSTIVHLDSAEVDRYTRAIDRLNAQYGWHLDAQKTLSRLGKKLGKKCGGGWISPEKKCKSHYTDGKLNSSGKTSSADLADRIRSRKKMTAIRSRDGKMKNGQWDIGAAFAPGNEQQSSIRASRTGPNNNRILNPDRAARMKAKEENRARVNWGKTTGDWTQKPDSTAAMDMEKPKQSKLTAMKGKGWGEVRHEGRKYDLNDIDDFHDVLMLKNHPAYKAVEVMRDNGVDELKINDLLVKIRERDFSQKKEAPTPIASGNPLKDLFSEADRIGAKYQTEPATMEERRIARQEADRIMEESGATEAVGRAIGKVAMIDPARTPVRIPNQRRSNEPRRRGRSVD